MDLNNIEIFYHVAKEKSFTGVGEKLFMTQSSVTKKIKALEEDLGVKLLHRTTKKVELTELGKEFFIVTEKIVNGLARYSMGIVDKDEVRVAIIGLFYNWAQSRVLSVIGEEYLSIQFYYGTKEFCIKLLENGEVDAIVSADETLKECCDFQKIGEINFGFFAEKNFNINEPYKMYVTQYGTFIDGVLSELLEITGFDPIEKIIIKTNDSYRIKEEGGNYIVFANCEMISKNVRLRELKMLAKTRNYNMNFYYKHGSGVKLIK